VTGLRRARATPLRALAARGVVAVSVVALAGCYDSRWGETKRAQQRAAQVATPAALRPAGDDDARARVATFRVRIVATARYAGQTVDWQKQTREVVVLANRILEASAGARLQIERLAEWSAMTADDDLPGALAALRAADAGDDVDWVIGMVGGLPRVTASFHDVGRADVLGKHIVLRAAAREGEHDRIEQSFDELGEDERARLRRDRKLHRALTMLLHEVGHTLGAPHEEAIASIMHPAYDPKMAGFSMQATEMMRIAVDRRASGTRGTPVDTRALAGDLAAYMRKATSSPWSEEERASSLALFDAMHLPSAKPDGAPAAAPTGQAPAPAASPVAAKGFAAPEALTDLRPADRTRFEEASTWFQRGFTDQAYATARPLFAAYPTTYAVQDLRCQLAVLRRVDASVLAKECDGLKRLSGK
jgi:hypothetical protein